jgi:hypothetical protein
LPELGVDRTNDAACQFILRFENIGPTVVKSVRPEVGATCRVDESYADPHPIAELAHTAFERVARGELAIQLYDVGRSAPDGKG